MFLTNDLTACAIPGLNSNSQSFFTFAIETSFILVED